MTATQTTDLLTTSAVSIETVQVSIQCVRIGPKQMTQAVFRQVPSQLLITGFGLTSRHDRTYALWTPDDVQLWGTVNYFWPQCDAEAYGLVSPPVSVSCAPHVHVLYAQHGRLLRDCLLYPGYVHQLIRAQARTSGAEREGHLTTYGALYETFWSDRVEGLPQLFIAV